MSWQLDALERVPLPEDTVDEIRRVILDFSIPLVKLNDFIWSASGEASCRYTHLFAYF